MDEEKRHPPRKVEPRVSEETAALGVSMLAAIPWFPTEDAARFMIAGELQSLCESQAEMNWLVRRMVRLFERWPGIPALRAVFCSKHSPLDRVESTGIIEAYPDGIPPELPPAAPPRLALPPGAVVSADSQLDAGVRLLSAVLDMNRIEAPVRHTPRAVASPVSANYQPITQADIDKAVQELHDRRARGEMLSPEPAK
jgi:hypothetical protein